MRAATSRLAAILFVVVLFPAEIWGQTPAVRPYPVLFVHGFCSSADTWSTMTALLSASNAARYGSAVTRVAAGAVLPPEAASRTMFALDFRGLTGSFDPLDVAQVSITAKAVELKQVIDEIKRVTGQPRVIVVAHSLGGLVARWYIQRGAGARGYEGDVAALVTIDTPNLGSGLAALASRADALDAFTLCLLLPSTNKVELIPGSETLRTLNASAWRTDTPVASIASWQTEFANPKSDAVVDYDSQNLLSVYPQLAGTSVFLIDNPISLGNVREILHILVHQLPSTIGLVNMIVSVVDRLQAGPSAPAAPQLTSFTDSTGAVTVQWTPAPTGGTPLAYVLRGTYRDQQGALTSFDYPVGSVTSVRVPSNLLGVFAVRVVALNAAGESAPSNEVTFSIP